MHGNLADFRGTSGLAGAVALFRGLKRPLIAGQRDTDFHVYVTNPKRTYSYRKFEEAPVERPAPFNSVFVTYVDFNAASVGEAKSAMKDPKIDGLIAFWEWVFADKSDPTLPEGFETRYDRRVW